MRIVHVISSIDARTGGTATAALGLLSAQKRAGLDVSLMHTFGAEDDSRRAIDGLNELGIEVESVGPASGRLLKHRGLGEALSRRIQSSDVVHVHALWEEIQFQACRIARRGGVKYVISPHGMLDPWSLSQSRWKKKFYLGLRMGRMIRGATALHFTSTMEFERSAGSVGGRVRPVIEPLGIDLEEFSNLPAKGSFRSRFAEIGERRIVLFLGRLHPKKGLELLIPAFKRATSAGEVLVIAGPCGKEYLAALGGIVTKEGLDGRVIFTGMLNGRERLEALADAYVFTLPSHQENFGLAVVESLACGCPVIISDQVNIFREIVAGGVGGVVETRVESVVAELSRWLGDEAMRNSASARAPGFVAETYDWRRVGEHWVKHYSELRE